MSTSNPRQSARIATAGSVSGPLTEVGKNKTNTKMITQNDDCLL